MMVSQGFIADINNDDEKSLTRLSESVAKRE